MSKNLGFIVDTDSYSGNFERELCAYVTGHVGSCGVGKSFILEFGEKLDFIDHRESEDYEGKFYPCCIYPTPNVYNNGMGFSYKDGEESIALKEFKRSMIRYHKKQLEYSKLVHGEIPEEVLNNYNNTINQVLCETEVQRNPSYQSVLIYLNREITEEELSFLKIRCESYFSNRDANITGYRLLK